MVRSARELGERWGLVTRVSLWAMTAYLVVLSARLVMDASPRPDAQPTPARFDAQSGDDRDRAIVIGER